MSLEQDIRAEIENIKKLKMAVGEINNHLSALEGMCRDNKEESYQKGYEDGKKSHDKTYLRGVEAAWEAAKKIVVDTDHGGLDWDALSEIFGAQNYTHIMSENTAQDAIDKIKAYEDKYSSIERGDWVIWSDATTLIVTAVYEDGGFNWCDGISQDGRAYHVLLENVCKTGKHYDIQSILGQ